jgi:uncharacterized protein YjbI with pentapeptide repeats
LEIDGAERNVKTIKPFKLGILTRTFELDHKHYFVPTVLAFCDLGPERCMFPEVELWQLAATELGKEAILDECMPKQHGELLVHGRCFTANRVPRTAASVRVKVGPIDKTLYVIGNRTWRRDGTPGEPEPFTEMPIHYSRAFGGEGHPLNPIGIGLAKIKENGQEIHRMPNIEWPGRLIQSKSDRPAPAGFGPFDITWAQRWPKIGTYDMKWVREQLPGLAKDMDLSMWNAAPEDQQLERGFFEGSEDILIQNMHPELPQIEGRLPGIIGRCFVTQKTINGDVFCEIPLHLDTVQIFPHHQRCALAFRGIWPIAEDDADDIIHLIVACDDRSTLRPLDHYRAVLERRLDPKREASESFRDSDLMPPNIHARGAGMGDIDTMFALTKSENLLQKNLAAKAQKEADKTRAIIAACGGDPNQMAFPNPAPVEEAPSFHALPDFIAKVQQQVAETERQARSTHEKSIEESRKQFAETGRDYDAEVRKMKKEAAGPPKFSADKEVERLRDIQTLCKNANVDSPELDEALGDPETLQRFQQAEDESINAYRMGAHLAEYRPHRVLEPARTELRTLVATAHAEGRSFARMNLCGADLSDMDLSGIDFTEVFLENACLARTNLAGARMQRAVLAAADLSEANLANADLTEANLGATNLRRANLDDAILTQAILVKSDLTGATLRNVVLDVSDLTETIFDGAVLTRARFDKAMLSGNKLRGCDLRESHFVHSMFIDVDFRSGNFSNCVIENATFLRCTMDGASFLQANLRGIRIFPPCSFVGANFRGATMDAATLRECDFSMADFSGATLNSSDLTKAILRGANLYRVVAKNALFLRADLTDARVVAANLEGAIFMKAKLARADFKGANLFRADMLRAIGDNKTNFTDANVTRVRVSPKEATASGHTIDFSGLPQAAKPATGV